MTTTASRRRSFWALEDYEDLFPHYQKYRTSTKFLETATSTAEGHISGFYELMSDFIGPFFGMMGRGDWIEALNMERSRNL